MAIQSETALSCNEKFRSTKLAQYSEKHVQHTPHRKAMIVRFDTHVSNRPITCQRRHTLIMLPKRIATQTLQTP